MKKIIVTTAVAAIVACIGCKGSTGGQPAQVQAGQTAGQVQPGQAGGTVQGTETGNQAGAGAAAGVPQKINIKAEPGRNMVITDLKVQTGRGVNVGDVKVQNPGVIRDFKPNQNVGAAPGKFGGARDMANRENENNSKLLKRYEAEKAEKAGTAK